MTRQKKHEMAFGCMHMQVELPHGRSLLNKLKLWARSLVIQQGCNAVFASQNRQGGRKHLSLLTSVRAQKRGQEAASH